MVVSNRNFLFQGAPIFRGELLVSRRVAILVSLPRPNLFQDLSSFSFHRRGGLARSPSWLVVGAVWLGNTGAISWWMLIFWLPRWLENNGRTAIIYPFLTSNLFSSIFFYQPFTKCKDSCKMCWWKPRGVVAEIYRSSLPIDGLFAGALKCNPKFTFQMVSKHEPRKKHCLTFHVLLVV